MGKPKVLIEALKQALTGLSLTFVAVVRRFGTRRITETGAGIRCPYLVKRLHQDPAKGLFAQRFLEDLRRPVGGEHSLYDFFWMQRLQVACQTLPQFAAKGAGHIYGIDLQQIDAANDEWRDGRVERHTGDQTGAGNVALLFKMWRDSGRHLTNQSIDGATPETRF